MISRYFTAVKDLTATAGGSSGDVVFTCPTNHVAVIKTLNISNGATSTKKYSIQWYEAETTTYHTISDETSLAANSNDSYLEGGGCFALKAGDKIVAFEETSSDFHVIISGDLYFQQT